jgi:hypothetical protein
MAWRLMPHGAQYIGNGPSPRRQQGAKQEDKESIVGGRGKRGSQHCKYRQGKMWHVHVKAASMAGVVLLRETVAPISP